jgi:trimeric autotransporter adhesin
VRKLRYERRNPPWHPLLPHMPSRSLEVIAEGSDRILAAIADGKAAAASSAAAAASSAAASAAAAAAAPSSDHYDARDDARDDAQADVLSHAPEAHGAPASTVPSAARSTAMSAAAPFSAASGVSLREQLSRVSYREALSQATGVYATPLPPRPTATAPTIAPPTASTAAAAVHSMGAMVGAPSMGTEVARRVEAARASEVLVATCLSELEHLHTAARDEVEDAHDKLARAAPAPGVPTGLAQSSILARYGAHSASLGTARMEELGRLTSALRSGGTLQAEALHSLEHALHPRRPWNEDELRLQSLAHDAGAPAAADTYSSASSETEASSSAFRQSVRFVDEAEVSSSASTAAGIAKRQTLARAPLQTLPPSAQAIAYPNERLLAIADRPRSRRMAEAERAAMEARTKEGAHFAKEFFETDPDVAEALAVREESEDEAAMEVEEAEVRGARAISAWGLAAEAVEAAEMAEAAEAAEAAAAHAYEWATLSDDEEEGEQEVDGDDYSGGDDDEEQPEGALDTMRGHTEDEEALRAEDDDADDEALDFDVAEATRSVDEGAELGAAKSRGRRESTMVRGSSSRQGSSTRPLHSTVATVRGAKRLPRERLLSTARACCGGTEPTAARNRTEPSRTGACAAGATARERLAVLQQLQAPAETPAAIRRRRQDGMAERAAAALPGAGAGQGAARAATAARSDLSTSLAGSVGRGGQAAAGGAPDAKRSRIRKLLEAEQQLQSSLASSLAQA